MDSVSTVVNKDLVNAQGLIYSPPVKEKKKVLIRFLDYKHFDCVTFLALLFIYFDLHGLAGYIRLRD